MAAFSIPQMLQNWTTFVQGLPLELEGSVRRYGALKRRRKIRSGQALLRLLLNYALWGSLRTAASVAAGMGLDLSAQALQERVHKARGWLEALIRQMGSALLERQEVVLGPEVRRLKIVDATVIARPSSSGAEWRLQVTLDPQYFQITHLRLTDAHTGEALQPEALGSGDLVLADRGYGRWSSLAVALAAKAFFVIRLPWNTIRWQHPDGAPFDLAAWLQRLEAAGKAVGEVQVVAADDAHQRPLRLIAGRLPAEAAEQARKRVRQQARKKKRKPHPTTLVVAGFCLVVTNLPAQVAPETVLALYRIRWQIEWWFRRWKSICKLEDLPAYPAKIAYPVLLAKILLILCLQWLLPDDAWWEEGEPPALGRLLGIAYAAACHIIFPRQSLIEILSRPWDFMRHLRLSKRKRPHQLAQLQALAAQIAALLP